MTETSEIRQEMASTRDRMSRDIDAIQSRASARVSAVKSRLDVAQLVREHPWLALGSAVALGAVVSGTGADAKAAAATAVTARRAAKASKSAIEGTVEKLHSDDVDEPEVRAPEKPGLSDRLFGSLGASVARALDRVLDEMRVASREWGSRMANSNSGRRPTPVPVAARPMATAVIVHEETTTTTSAAEAVPVPNEMMPSELDARADAVEALGGGTNEPPLAPGAGDLGARWS
jgi:hypothetical protein